MTAIDLPEALRCARFAIEYSRGHAPAWLLAHYRHLELLVATGSATETAETGRETCWITTTEAAEILGITPQYLRREKVARSFGGRRVSDSFWTFDKAEVEEHAAERNQPVAE